MLIDHVGIAVRSIEKSIDQWISVFGYKQKTEVVINTRQKVKVVFLEKKESVTIKLIEPTDETSPIYTMAKKGGGLHHLCFQCNNVYETIDELKGKGLRVITEPQPGEAFDDEPIAFLFAKNGMNIELIDTDKRAGLIE